MSLHRLALRLAAVEALRPYATGANGPWPTIACARVYDSREVPIDDLDDQDVKPTIIVYTETDMATPYGEFTDQVRYPADENIVHLVIEHYLAVRGTIDVAQPDGSVVTMGTLSAPATDETHEAVLDVMEATVRRVLDPRNMAKSAAAYSAVAMEIRRIESVPMRATDKTTRILARTLTLTIKTPPDAWPPAQVTAGAVVQATGLARLPQPLLGVAQKLDPSSPGGLLCAALASSLPGPDGYAPMQGMTIYGGINRVPSASANDITGSV